MNPLILFRKIIAIAIALLLVRFAVQLVPNAFGVVPPPVGGYPNFNTAAGQNALFSLTTGIGNTAVGWASLFSETDGSFNTALGAGTLLFNVGDQTTGFGIGNTAIGAVALLNNTTGYSNTAVGYEALLSNTTGGNNTAVGRAALSSNTGGGSNTAIGTSALHGNTGGSNTAVGYFALGNNENGNANTALGNSAGVSIRGAGNVCIGEGVSGDSGVNSTTWIRNVYASVATTRAVYVNSDNKIGTLSSSHRYKEEIKAMDKASDALFALKPVTFRYKKEIDRSQVRSFGLIAEEVADVSPDLITRDEQGKPQTVRYEAVNAMLLNEFLKEHRKVESLEKAMAEQQKENVAMRAMLKEQAAQIQKVSAQLELSKPEPQTVLNNP
jgi:hypothetical protein